MELGVLEVDEFTWFGKNGPYAKSVTCPVCHAETDTSKNNDLIIVCTACGQQMTIKPELDKLQ